MTKFPAGESVYLRALEKDDIDLIYQWENDMEAWKVSSSITPYSKFVLEQYLKNAHLDIYETKQLRLVIVKKDNDVPVGTIELFDFDPFHLRAGVGIMIHKHDEKQKGYGYESMKLFVDYAFSHLGLHQVYCNVAEDNEASLKLFEKLGFKIVGKKKEWIKNLQKGWIDEYLLQLIQN